LVRVNTICSQEEVVLWADAVAAFVRKDFHNALGLFVVSTVSLFSAFFLPSPYVTCRDSG
jgi:hypothetical protein